MKNQPYMGKDWEEPLESPDTYRLVPFSTPILTFVLTIVLLLHFTIILIYQDPSPLYQSSSLGLDCFNS